MFDGVKVDTGNCVEYEFTEGFVGGMIGVIMRTLKKMLAVRFGYLWSSGIGCDDDGIKPWIGRG